MADNKIFIGIDAPEFKLGASDVTLYLGNTKVYPLTFKLKLTYSNGATYQVPATGSTILSQADVRGGTQDKANIVSAEISNYVTSLGDSCFSGCTSLTSVTIPDSVTRFYDFAFRDCYSLTNISIPSSVTRLGDYCFRGCSGLTSVNIPSSIASLTYGSFYGCYGLTSVTMSNGTTSLGNYCFYQCTGLTSVNIPSTVTSMGTECFYQCSSLTNINIPSGISVLNTRSFYACGGLTSVTIPDSVTSIGQECFEFCSSLTNINIPSGVTSLGTSCFANCSGLTTVEIESGITSIAYSSFYRCSGLTSITVNATTPPTLGDSVFDFTNDCPIYVPCESVSAYKAATNWSTYESRIQCDEPTPMSLQWIEFTSESSIPSDLEIYGVSGVASDLVVVFSYSSDPIYFSLDRRNVEIWINGEYNNTVANTDTVELVFSDIISVDKLTVDNATTQYLSNSIKLLIMAPVPVDYTKEYLTITAREAGVITVGTMYAGNKSQYSLDGGETWSELKTNTNTTPTLSAGQKVLWRGSGSAGESTGSFTFSGTTIEFDVEGNPLSLFCQTKEAISAKTSYHASMFRHMFQDTKVVNAENLAFVEGNTVNKLAFASMFNRCTSLVKAPKVIPQFVYSSSSYASGFCQYMFYGCTSLTTAPELPATSLRNYCYSYMFQGCTSLTTAPELPATTLVISCYSYMFQGCTSLTTAPELPATTLASNCYSSMFRNCSNLNYIKAMFTTTPSSSYTGDWVNGVASSGTFVKNSAATWNVTGVNGIPTGWTVQTASA